MLRGMRPTGRVIASFVPALLSGGLSAVDAATPGLSSPPTRPLAYVESSAGLVPPTLEGGGTEIEMGDVDGDGRLDLVSIGVHGSPYVNTDQHGVMV